MADSTDSKDKILYELKSKGPRTARVLGESLSMTTMGVRQHLAQLEEQGLIDTTPEEVVGRGRPVRRWKLTEAGHRRFPDAHAQVTTDLIASVRELFGQDALNQIIKKRGNETLKHYEQQLIATDGLEKKLKKLGQIRTLEGYMAEVVKDGEDYLLLENHCPICVAAEACQGFCQAELELFQQVLKGVAQVAREDHILHGARRCSYRVIPIK